MYTMKQIITLLLLSVSVTLFSQNSENQHRDFAKIVYNAIQNNEKIISIPKGVYYMELENGEPLTLDSIQGLTIDCNGSEIITKKASQAINITNCENITLKNFSIDCDPLPFSQAEIVNMDTINRMWWEVEIMEGYPVPNIAKSIPDRVQIFDPKTLTLKKNLYTYWRNSFESVKQTGERKYLFTKKEFNPDSNEMIGDYITMTLEDEFNTRPHSIVLYKSKNIHFENITIWSGNCFGFFEDQCESNSYNNCKIDRKMDDSKVSFPRLRSINADAFHSKAAVVGPTITDCIFRYHADDCIAINTSFYKVITNRGKSIDIVSHIDRLKMEESDTLCFINFNGEVVGNAILLKKESVKDFAQKDLDEVNDKYRFTVDKRRHTDVTRLFIDREIEVDNGGVVSSITRGGNGYVIRNNIIGHTRARGILIKASDGIIENNEVVGCELGGIVLAPELVWLEAGFSNNVTIENNRIIDCMFANSSYGIEQAAPLCVVAINAKNEVAPAGGFKNIVVRNNMIINSPVPAMIFTSIQNGVVENNTVIISDTIKRNHGKVLKIFDSEPVWKKNNQDIVFRNNVIK